MSQDQGLSPLLMRQLRKLGLSESDLPKDLQTWNNFLIRINKAYAEYDEARISSDNVLAVSLYEMELMQKERAKINADTLNELNANLSLVVQASELGVWDWNLETNQVIYDKRWCEILGYSTDELEHKLQTFIDFTHPEDIDRVLKSAQDCIEKKVEKFDIKFQMNHKNGQWIHIHAKGKITKINDEGKPLRFMGTHNDFTEEIRIQKEVELQKNKLFHQSKLASLGEMSAGIAHEVNNPLAIIAGSAEIIGNFRDNPAKFDAKRESILKSCDRISKILNGLKKFSRSAEQNKQRIFNLGSVIDEVLILTDIKSSRFLTPVIKECAADLSIVCDDLGIEQVLINLINNAIDAVKNNDEKWVKITAHKEDDHILLRVIDSGPVIPSELENKIFEPFFTTKSVGEGTGLGLSITKGILDEHQATIVLNRTFSTTCFEIKFVNLGASSDD
jgi:PAS domain S-box-containing protein